jgi:hypothetical protein
MIANNCHSLVFEEAFTFLSHFMLTRMPLVYVNFGISFAIFTFSFMTAIHLVRLAAFNYIFFPFEQTTERDMRAIGSSFLKLGYRYTRSAASWQRSRYNLLHSLEGGGGGEYGLQ